MKISQAQYRTFCTTPPADVSGLLFYSDDRFLSEKNLFLFWKTHGISSAQVDKVTEHSIVAGKIFINDFFLSPGLFSTGEKYMYVADATDNIVPHVQEFLDVTTMQAPQLFLASSYLAPRSKLRRLFESSERAAVLPCYALTEREIRKIILERTQIARKTIAPTALEKLIQGAVDNIASMDMEWEKILLYVGDAEEISAEDVCAMVSPSVTSDNNDIMQAFLNGRVSELHKLLIHAFAQSGVTAVGIIRLLMQQLLRLLHARLLQQQGLSADQACQAVSPVVPVFQRRDFLRYMQHWTEERLRRSLNVLTRLEVTLKRHADVGNKIFMQYILCLAYNTCEAI